MIGIDFTEKKVRQVGLFMSLVATALVSTLVVLAQSAQPNVKFEVESGVLSGQAATASDSLASGGSYVAFEANTPPPSGSTFSETFSNLSNWTFSDWRQEMPGGTDPGSSGSIVNGRLVVVAADQNYGDATLRSARLYDVRNGGTFSFDISLFDGQVKLVGYPFVAFSDQPVNSPSFFADNGAGTGPRNGGYYQFAHTCAIPWATGDARQFINYVETAMPGGDNCLGQATITEGQLNRVELRYDGNNGWELWVSDAGTTAPLKRLRAFTMQIPEIGYFTLGTHNHASVKYGGGPVVNTTYDNVSYPAANLTSSSYRNGAGVDKTNATTAHVSFNGYSSTTAGPFSLTVNGNTVAFTPVFHGSRSFPASVEVPLTAVNNGANTITVQGFTNFSNLDLVLTRNAP